jgi:glycosyltransferase involved in cell wall biosynthesis
MTDAPLTVLHLAANRWWTGSADPTIQLITGLGARGHRVSLAVTPGDRFEAKAREAGVNLVERVRLDPRFAPVGAFRDVARLRRVVRATGIEILHAHHSHDHWIAVLVAGAGRQGRIPVVRTFHNRRSVKSTPLTRVLHRRTAAAFAVSRQIELRCRDAGFPADRVVWIPGSADLPRFSAPADAGPIRDEFKLGRAPVIASVARFARNRGHEALLAGFRLVLREVPDARLLLVGKGETRGRLEQIVVDLGLAERVIFTGYRDRDLPAVLAAADCFVLMAPGSDESCRAALEAMAAGRVVVAGRHGALPDTVVHGETGWLLDDDRPENVAAALSMALSDRARAMAMGEAGRRRAADVFGPTQSVAIVERTYRMLR